MNLNPLYNMFSSKPKLRRDDIAKYGSTSDQRIKHSIEMQSSSDSFESDAMDGWDQLSYDTSIMKDLDRKFLKRSYTGYYILSVLGTVAITIVVFLNNSSNNHKNSNKPAQEKIHMSSLTEDQEITLDESDLIIPSPIEKMKLAPIKHQVKVTTIQDEFQERKTTYMPEEEIKIEMLPFIDLYPQPEAPKLEKAHDRAKEIYLHDLKLVDYTSYRSKPTMKTKQATLTGTPANMEASNSDEIETVWKEVDVSYSFFIDKSIAIFSKGSYKKALARFETVIETYHDDVNANFYSGLCLYNLGEYEKSIDAFKNCIYGPFSNFDEESQWMIALSYQKLGQKDQAKKYFLKIIEQGGFYKNQAATKMK